MKGEHKICQQLTRVDGAPRKYAAFLVRRKQNLLVLETVLLLRSNVITKDLATRHISSLCERGQQAQNY